MPQVAPAMVFPLPRLTLTLLLLLPLLASAYRVRAAASVVDDTHHEVPGHRYKGPYHSHGGVLQQVRICCYMPHKHTDSVLHEIAHHSIEHVEMQAS